MKTRLITGSTGFVGINLTKRFLEEGDSRLVLLARPSKDRSAEERVKDGLKGYDLQNVEVIEGDVSKPDLGMDPGKMRDLGEEVDEIWHLAAATDMGERSRDQIFSVNLKGTEYALDFAHKVGGLELFAYTSTAYVAGKQRGLVLENRLDMSQGFNNPYEKSKAIAEQRVRDAIDNGLNGIIFRPSVIVGDSRTGETSNFRMIYGPWLAIMLAKEMYLRKNPTPQIEDGKTVVPFRIVGKESATLNIIPVDYVVDMMVKLAGDEGNMGKTFHLTHDDPVTIGLLKDQFCEHLGITGVEYVGSSELVNPNVWERAYLRRTMQLRSYMIRDDPIFDRTQVKRSLGSGYSIPPPDARLIKTLIDYCDSVNWGRKEK